MSPDRLQKPAVTRLFSTLYCVAMVQYNMSRDVRKPVFGISDQVRHKPGCTATEDG